LTVCGLPDALSVIVNVPLRVPAAVGVKVTSIEQLPPAATEFPHVFISAKSPVTVMLVTVSEAPPLFVNVTAC
jgi:hypothetical protein